MGWEQFIIIFITAIVTAGASNFFGYWKERKFARSVYADKVLTDLYVPIYRILNEETHTYHGYKGINSNQINRIMKIIESNPELCEPFLEETVRFMYSGSKQAEAMHIEDLDSIYLDANKDFYKYVVKSFNSLRRNLGLPAPGIKYLVYKIRERNLENSLGKRRR